MLSLSRKTDYALVALARLARQQEGVPPSVEPISARQIAAEFALPAPMLMNLLKRLQQAGLVSSTRGTRGGYRLVVDPAGISVARVVEAIDGPIAITLCCSEHQGKDQCDPCMIMRRCPIMGSMHRFNAQIRDFLEQTTLKDLLEESGESRPVPLMLAKPAGGSRPQPTALEESAENQTLARSPGPRAVTARQGSIGVDQR